ncbi:hypothetical protein N7532_008164 [Penicillium argentinense]|uniref:DUF7580 domain-containing protein n=1 Tax=Penicillium argentinense TaxID=1131581 RepID=A0A9W9EX62_9EURO|nr:uncharacterized protein N7532_008164 [Penicillium argentinense]KAJ5089480.1 hypothetical protein N7532_008164 [Penicillium argentinense]
METAGVALAVLPLLLNQMDNYVQGIETFKLLRSKRYRRELEWYRTNLKTQETILKNILLGLVNGVVEYEDEVDDMINNPLGYLLRSECLRSSLRQKLGISFDPFIQMMTEFSNLLNDLYRKLGWKTGSSVVDTRRDKSLLKAELRKFKDIFSKSIYEGIMTRIETANSLLKTLAEQADHRTIIQKMRITKRPLIRQKKVRKSARSLHSAIISGKCWKCSCRDRHAVHFMLKYPELSRNEEESEASPDCRFRMIFAYTGTIDNPRLRDPGLEIETESEISQSEYNLNNCPPHCITGKRAIPKEAGFTIQGGLQKNSVASQANKVPSILDLCVSLSTIGASGQPNQLFGCFSDESHRHNMYYIRDIAASLEMKSLSELIADSGNFFKVPTDGHFLTQKQRLRLAVNLACSVLQFHGSWLKTHWRAKDIIFITAADIENPFVRWIVGDEDNMWGLHEGKGKGRASSPLIQSDILFPLGLVLVELSLCQTLEALRTAEDEDRMEACADLKTAARYVDLVAQQSGTEYKRVVKTCLFWPGTEEFDLDNEEVQDDMFRLIISPLIENLKIFEGG